jgi:hypothetical protein
MLYKALMHSASASHFEPFPEAARALQSAFFPTASKRDKVRDLQSVEEVQEARLWCVEFSESSCKERKNPKKSS